MKQQFIVKIEIPDHYAITPLDLKRIIEEDLTEADTVEVSFNPIEIAIVE